MNGSSGKQQSEEKKEFSAENSSGKKQAVVDLDKNFQENKKGKEDDQIRLSPEQPVQAEHEVDEASTTKAKAELSLSTEEAKLPADQQPEDLRGPSEFEDQA